MKREVEFAARDKAVRVVTVIGKFIKPELKSEAILALFEEFKSEEIENGR